MNYDESYREITTLFENGKFAQAACHINVLMLQVMKDMYAKAVEKMPSYESKALRTLESEILRGERIEDIDLKNMTNLFERSKFLVSVKGTESEGRLLRAYDLTQIASLSLECCNPPKDMQSYDLMTSVRWLLEFATHLLRFNGWLSDEVVTSQQTLAEGQIMTQFLLDLRLGILRNMADLARNVSFKAVTFVTMLGFICDQLLAEGPPLDKSRIPEMLNRYLFTAGNMAGLNFGTALLDKLDLGLSIKQKIDKWCSFDTRVGWGKFRNEVIVDDATGRISGKIILDNNFLVTNRGRRDFNLCSLMTGYVSGVLEKLLRMPVKVRHDRAYTDCAQFAVDKLSCEFVLTDVEK